MGLGPAWAMPLALKRAGLTPDQVDVWEVHEAFSAQALGVLRELSNQLGGFTIPDDNLSPNGGAVATGHPFGASGTRYLLTLATELRERNARYGVIGCASAQVRASRSFSRTRSQDEEDGRRQLDLTKTPWQSQRNGCWAAAQHLVCLRVQHSS